MTEQKICDVLKELLIDLMGLDIDINSFNEENDITLLGISSLQIISYIIAIEDTFGFEFDDEDLTLSRLKTIKALSQYVLERSK